MTDPDQGIVHVISPELALALPGLTIVCPDSHTCTQGGIGALAWGIGSTEAEHALSLIHISAGIFAVYGDAQEFTVTTPQLSEMRAHPRCAAARRAGWYTVPDLERVVHLDRVVRHRGPARELAPAA